MSTGKKSDSPAPPVKVIVRSYPKICLLYPTLIAALVAGITVVFSPERPPEPGEAAPVAEEAAPVAEEAAPVAEEAAPVAEEAAPAADAALAEVDAGQPRGLASTATLIFLLVLGLNIIVLAFDFPRTTSLTLFFLVVAVVSVLLWLNQSYDVVGWLSRFIDRLHPLANAHFYFLVAGGLVLVYICVFIATRFDYWEIMHNELIHHHGILGNVNRYPAPQLKLEKEITDVFEFFLMRSGRLLIHPSSERRAIVLENVPSINRRESEIQELLRALSVHIHEHTYAQDD